MNAIEELRTTLAGYSTETLIGWEEELKVKKDLDSTVILSYISIELQSRAN